MKSLHARHARSPSAGIPHAGRATQARKFRKPGGCHAGPAAQAREIPHAGWLLFYPPLDAGAPGAGVPGAGARWLTGGTWRRSGRGGSVSGSNFARHCTHCFMVTASTVKDVECARQLCCREVGVGPHRPACGHAGAAPPSCVPPHAGHCATSSWPCGRGRVGRPPPRPPRLPTPECPAPAILTPGEWAAVAVGCTGTLGRSPGE